MGGQGELWSWADDDFVDVASSEPLPEDDPWDVNSWATSAAGSLPKSAPNDEFPIPKGGEGDGVSPWDFADELADVDPGDQWSQDPIGPPSDWVEPDPTIDASSELSESLYPPDRTITDITRDLKIGELLARVRPITEEQRTRCHEVLSACGIGRLRRWVPWLRNLNWSGPRLLLFLEFRRHWESNANVRWWETFWWDPREQEWTPTYQPGTLTLDHCRELVENRAHCAVADVIDPRWFLEWDDCAVWELGLPSFARFAVFRSGIADGVDWRERLSRCDRRSQLEVAQCADSSYAPFMLPSFAQQHDLAGLVGAEPDPWPDVTEMARRAALVIDR